MQNRIDELQRELDRTGVSWQTVLRRYGLSDINQMTPEQYRTPCQVSKSPDQQLKKGDEKQWYHAMEFWNY